MNDLLQCKGKKCGLRCMLSGCKTKEAGGCYHECKRQDAISTEEMLKDGTMKREGNVLVYIPKQEDPQLDYVPLAIDVEVGYRFHEARICRTCIYIRTSNKARKKLLYRSGVHCRGTDARILNDKWIVNLRGPDWKPRRVIKLKKRR